MFKIYIPGLWFYWELGIRGYAAESSADFTLIRGQILQFLTMKSLHFRKHLHCHECATEKGLALLGCCSQRTPLAQETALPALHKGLCCAILQLLPSASWAASVYLLIHM